MFSLDPAVKPRDDRDRINRRINRVRLDWMVDYIVLWRGAAVRSNKSDPIGSFYVVVDHG
jgi:hypothetical protein